MKLPPISEYFRHILTLLGGSALSQLILVAAAPLLTRFFSPAEFGVFAVFTAISTILGMVACGRYEIAVLLPKEDFEAIVLLRICLRLAIIFGGFLLSVALILQWLPQKFSWSGIVFWIAASVVLQGFSLAFGAFANRKQQYRVLSRARIFGSAITVAVSLFLGKIGYGSDGLIFGRIAGQVGEVLAMLASFQFSILAESRSILLKSTFYKYANFLKFSTLEAFLNTAFRQVPVFALSSWFSTTATGQFSMATNVTAKPLGMVGAAVGQVFLQKAAVFERSAPSMLPSFFKKNVALLALFATAILLPIVFFGAPMFAWVFGKPWREVGIFAAWLSPFVALSFVKAPLSAVVDIKNKLRENLVFETAFLVFAIFSFWFAFRYDSALLGVQLFSASYTIVGLIQLGWYYKLTFQDSNSTVKP